MIDLNNHQNKNLQHHNRHRHRHHYRHRYHNYPLTAITIIISSKSPKASVEEGEGKLKGHWLFFFLLAHVVVACVPALQLVKGEENRACL